MESVPLREGLQGRIMIGWHVFCLVGVLIDFDWLGAPNS